jgi:hypothetical protein
LMTWLDLEHGKFNIKAMAFFGLADWITLKKKTKKLGFLLCTLKFHYEIIIFFLREKLI